MGFMSNGLRRYAEWLVAAPRLIVVVTVAITALLLSRLGSLQIDMDPDLWAPQAHPYIQATNELEKVFGGRNVTLIGLVPRHGDIYQPAVLAKIQRLQLAIQELPQAVRHNVISLGARKVKSIRGTSDGMEVRQMMERIPETPEGIAQLQAAMASLPIYIGTLVSRDGQAAAIIADFKMDKSRPSYTAIMDQLRPIVERERDAQVDIYLGGLPVMISWFEFHMMKMPLYFGLALLIVAAIQWWSFRSVQGMLLPTSTAILSVIWALGLMGMLGTHMDPMNTTTPILIMAVAAGHAIQILKRYYEEYHRLQASTRLRPWEANRAAVVESLTRVGPVMVLAGLIAAITFYSLSVTGIPMVRHFGVFAGSGVLSALILEFTLIPALRTMLPAPKPKEAARERQAGILDQMLLWVARSLVGGRAPWIMAGALTLLVLVAAGLPLVHVDNSNKGYFKPTSEFRVHDDVLNARFAGTSTLQFLIETPAPDGLKDPKVLEAIAALQTFLQSQPQVGGTQSIVDLVKRMNQAMHGDHPDAYSLPARRDLIAQYLFLYSLSGDPQDFDSFVDNDYRKAAVWAFLKTDSSAYADALFKKAQALIAHSFPAGVTVRMGGSLPQTIALNEVCSR